MNSRISIIFSFLLFIIINNNVYSSNNDEESIGKRFSKFLVELFSPKITYEIDLNKVLINLGATPTVSWKIYKNDFFWLE